MTASADRPDAATRLATVAAAAAGKGVLARVASQVEDLHIDIRGQRWVLWPGNGWWAARLDGHMDPIEPPAYVGADHLAPEEVVDRVITGRFTVSPFDNTPLPLREDDPTRRP